MPPSELPPRAPLGDRARLLPKFQFSLFHLLVLMTVVALILGLPVAFGWLVPMILGLFWCVLPTPFVICALFGRGDIRAFSIGALIPWVLIRRDIFASPNLLLPLWLLTMPAVCGAVAVFTYRWIRRNDLRPE